MKKGILISALFLMPLVIFGCRAPVEEEIVRTYDRPLPAGQLALRKITNSYEIPDFTMACLDLADLRTSVGNSINYLQKPSSREFYPIGPITHSKVLNGLREFAAMLDSGLSGSQLNDAILAKFDVYMSIGCDDMGTVLFTGYYTPIFEASMTRTDKFRYPLYTTPEDLVKDSTGTILGRRGSDGSISPYPARAEIVSSGMLEGGELCWLADPFEAYVAHVQGSAKLRLPDGKLITIGYDATNGHEYKSVAQELVRDGRIATDKISLSTMIDYFKANPNYVDFYVNRNPRFVFFRIESGQPLGSLSEPVIPLRSIATDKSIFPRGCLTFIATNLPQNLGGNIVKRIYSGFALDQDTGGAIRAPGRCDVYMGEGEIAGTLAGQTYQEGKLYYLVLK